MHRKVKLSDDDDDDDEEADAEQRTTTRRCNNKVPILPILRHLGAICLDSRRGNLFLHPFLHATLSTLASQDMLTHTNHQRWLRTTAELLLYRDPRSFCHYTLPIRCLMRARRQSAHSTRLDGATIDHAMCRLLFRQVPWACRRYAGVQVGGNIYCCSMSPFFSISSELTFRTIDSQSATRRFNRISSSTTNNTNHNNHLSKNAFPNLHRRHLRNPRSSNPTIHLQQHQHQHLPQVLQHQPHPRQLLHHQLRLRLHRKLLLQLRPRRNRVRRKPPRGKKTRQMLRQSRFHNRLRRMRLR